MRQAFRDLEQEVPRALGRGIRRLRHPKARLVRVPAGLFLTLGGIFSFLPALGIWMLPLGLLLLAVDVPRLQKPVGRSTIWSLRKWAALRERVRQKR